VLRRVLSVAAVLALTALPAFAQEDVLEFDGFNPFDAESLIGAATSASCPNGDATPEPLPDGAEGFMIPGTFLDVQAIDLCRAYELPLRVGVPYKAIRIEFDMYVKRWVTAYFHNITALRRTAPKRNERVLLYGVIIRGDRRRTWLDLGHEKVTKEVHPWKENTQYRVVLEANRESKKIRMDVYEGETWSHGIQGKMTAREIKSLGGSRVVKVDFSSPGVAFNGYFPPTGWVFSNLKVTAVP
jgi:hypothetical protein